MKKLLIIVAVLGVLDLQLGMSAEVDCTGTSCYEGSKAAASYPGKPLVHHPLNGTTHLLPHSAAKMQLTSFKCGSVSCPQGSTCCGDGNCCEQENGICCPDPQYCCANGKFCCGEDTIWCCANGDKCSKDFGHCTGEVSSTVVHSSTEPPTVVHSSTEPPTVVHSSTEPPTVHSSTEPPTVVHSSTEPPTEVHSSTEPPTVPHTSTVPTGAASVMDMRVWVRALLFVAIALLAVI